MPETLTVSPAMPLLDQFSTSQAERHYTSVSTHYSKPGANIDPHLTKGAELHRSVSSRAQVVHLQCSTHHHLSRGTSYNRSSAYRHLKGSNLSMPPPRLPPMHAYEPLSQAKAPSNPLHTVHRDQPKTRIAHWPRPRLPLAAADPVTKRSLDDDQRSSCLERWGHILSR